MDEFTIVFGFGIVAGVGISLLVSAFAEHLINKADDNDHTTFDN